MLLYNTVAAVVDGNRLMAAQVAIKAREARKSKLRVTVPPGAMSDYELEELQGRLHRVLKPLGYHQAQFDVTFPNEDYAGGYRLVAPQELAMALVDAAWRLHREEAPQEDYRICCGALATGAGVTPVGTFELGASTAQWLRQALPPNVGLVVPGQSLIRSDSRYNDFVVSQVSDLWDREAWCGAQDSGVVRRVAPKGDYDLSDYQVPEEAVPGFFYGLVLWATVHRPLVLIGKGRGGTMLARRCATLLPRPTADIAAIHALAQMPTGEDAAFRAPHHSVSLRGLTGTPDRPGELQLATGGVFFLDEPMEWRHEALHAVDANVEKKTSRLVVSVDSMEDFQRLCKLMPSLERAIVLQLPWQMEPSRRPLPPSADFRRLL